MSADNLLPGRTRAASGGLTVIPHDFTATESPGSWEATPAYSVRGTSPTRVASSWSSPADLDIAAALTAFLAEAYILDSWAVTFYRTVDKGEPVELSIAVDGNTSFKNWARQFRESSRRARHSRTTQQVTIAVLPADGHDNSTPLREAVRHERADAVLITIEGSAAVRAHFDSAFYDGQCIDSLMQAASDAVRLLTASDDATSIEACISSGRQLRELPSADTSEAFDAADMVAGIARRQPDAIALDYADAYITYGELYRASRAMAQVIRSHAANTNRVVLSGSTGPALVGLILASVLGRITFTVIDSDEPARRATEVLRQLDHPPLVVTAGAASPSLQMAAAECSSRIFAVSTDLRSWATVESSDDDAKSTRAIDPRRDVLYTAFTSGSTAKPKGISMSTSSFGQFIDRFIRYFELGSESRLALWAAPFYDAHYCEIFAALCSGATLCIPRETDKATADATNAWLDRSAVTHLEAVPTVVLRLLKALRRRSHEPMGGPAEKTHLRHLRAILCAGETLPSRLVHLLRDTLGSEIALYNLYGPSECILATWAHVEVTDIDLPRVPIGTPIAGREVFIVDRFGRRKQTGLIGEIEIVSPHLVPSYTGHRVPENSALTIQSDAQVAFRTGDIGRLRADGRLEYLGRIGSMVKRHGVRIETKEVEAAVEELPTVDECAVITSKPPLGRASADAGDRLIAFVVGAADEQTIRRHLVMTLPTQLHPDEIRVVHHLAWLPNGKLNYRALAALAETRSTAAREGETPLTPTEQKIAGVYQDVLGRPSPPGRNDNFFAIGGHSLAAAEAVDRINGSLGTGLTVRDIFRHPVIADLATSIAQHDTGRHDQASLPTDSPAATPIAASRPEAAPLSAAQLGIFVSQSITLSSGRHNVSVAFQLHGSVDNKALERSAQAVLDLHPVFRHRFTLTPDGPRQTVAKSAVVSLRKVVLTESDTSSALGEVLREIVKPFNLPDGPLLRFLIVQLGDERYILLLTTHHIVCDEASLHLIARTISSAYNDAVSGLPPPTPVHRSRYLEFVAWTDADIDQARLERFWRSRFQNITRDQLGTTPRYTVDLDHSRVASTSISLSREAAHTLRTVAGTVSASLSMMITAVVAVCLSRFLQRSWVIIEVPVSLRGRKWQDVVGCFATAVPLPIHVSDSVQFGQLLRSVRDLSLDSFDNAGASYQLLKRAAGDLTDPMATLGDAVVAVHEQPDPVLNLTDVRCSPYPHRAPVLRSSVATYWRTQHNGALSCTIETDSHHPGLDATSFSRALRSVLDRAFDLDVSIADLHALVSAGNWR